MGSKPSKSINVSRMEVPTLRMPDGNLGDPPGDVDCETDIWQDKVKNIEEKSSGKVAKVDSYKLLAPQGPAAGSGGSGGGGGRTSLASQASIYSTDSQDPGGRCSLQSVLSNTSARSSFAQERVSFDIRGFTLEFAPILEKGGVSAAQQITMMSAIPREYHQYYQHLVILPPDTPIPLVTLRQFWDLGSMEEASKVAEVLELLGAMRVAQLGDGTKWCLVTPVQRDAFGSQGPQCAPLHKKILDVYTHNGTVPVTQIADDGYIQNHLSHHLVGAGRLGELKELLTQPVWLETKLRVYGAANIVTDFRRYLQLLQDEEVKLMLQAFQMSLGHCAEHPSVLMLRPQVLMRLMARSSSFKDHHRQECDQYLKDSDLLVGKVPVHLLTRTATLEQAGGLQRMALRGHNGPVVKVAISPMGQDIVTISEDGTAQVWDMEIGDCVLQLAAGEPLSAMAITPKGDYYLAGSEGGHCYMWEARSGALVRCLKGHKARVNSMCVTPSGQKLITGSSDCTARMWDLGSGTCLNVLKGHGGAVMADVGVVTDVAVSADGMLLATASDDFTVKVWNLKQEKLQYTLQGHSGWVVSVQFLGKSYILISASHDTTARVWDAWHGHCLEILQGHDGRINKVIVSGDGSLAVTCSDDFTARVWSLEEMTCLNVLKGHGGWVNDAAISKDGLKVVTVSGDNTGLVWNTVTGKCEVLLEGHSDEIKSVALTSKGRFVVTGSVDGTARVWDLQATALRLPEDHTGKVRTLAVDHTGSFAVSIGDDCDTRVWNIQTGQCMSVQKGHFHTISWLHMVEDGNTFLTGSGNRRVCSWELGTGQPQIVLHEQQGSRVKSMAFDAAGSIAAVVLFDSTLSIVDIKTGECRMQLIRKGERDGVRVHSGGVNAVYLTKDGSTAVTVSKDCTARVWDVVAGVCMGVLEGHEDAVQAACLGNDQATLVTVSLDGTARVWDLRTLRCHAVLEHGYAVSNAYLSPDDQYLITVAGNNVAWLWRLDTGQCTTALPGHKDTIYGAAFSPDSSYAATFSQDCLVQVWCCATGRVQAFFKGDAAITCGAFAGSDTTHTLVVGDASGVVHFLEIPYSMKGEDLLDSPMGCKAGEEDLASELDLGEEENLLVAQGNCPDSPQGS